MVVAAAKAGYQRDDLEAVMAARAGNPVRFGPQAHDDDPSSATGAEAGT